MNLFIIPSWYPSSDQPLSGIFIREQVEAIVDIKPDISIVVSNWNRNCEIDLRKPISVLKSLRNYIQDLKKGESKTEMKGYVEISHPYINWSRRIPFGGVYQLLKLNRRNLLWAIKELGKIDLIHAHVSYPAGFVASRMSEEFDIPFVLTEHMSPFPFPSYLKDGRPIKEIDHAFQKAITSIAVSPFLSKCIESYQYSSPIVVPNLVNELRFNIGESKTQKFVFLSLALISEQKGIDILLKSIAKWNPPSEKFEFQIAGDGPELSDYMKLSAELGLLDRVRWLGHVSREDAPNVFKNCNVFVLPSRHETFGVVYAEAIATGKPIIATRCGGPESIVNKLNGLLVDVGDIIGLADAMQKMAINWKSYNSIDIRNDFLNRFSRPTVVHQLIEVYKQAMNDQNG